MIISLFLYYTHKVKDELDDYKGMIMVAWFVAGAIYLWLIYTFILNKEQIKAVKINLYIYPNCRADKGSIHT